MILARNFNNICFIISNRVVNSTVANWPNAGSAAIVRVPIGEALLVLVSDTDAAIHNGETALDSDGVTAGLQPISKRVSFFPRTELPTVLMVVP